MVLGPEVSPDSGDFHGPPLRAVDHQLYPCGRSIRREGGGGPTGEVLEYRYPNVDLL